MKISNEHLFQLDLFSETEDVRDIGFDITRTGMCTDLEHYAYTKTGPEMSPPEIIIHIARIDDEWTWSTECGARTGYWGYYPHAKYGSRAATRAAAFRAAVREIEEGIEKWFNPVSQPEHRYKEFARDYKDCRKLLESVKAHPLDQP